MIIFTPNSVIKSSDVNANFNGLQTGTDINSGAITPDKRSGGFYVGTFTPTAGTGNKSYTGIGFTPKLVEFQWIGSSNVTGTGSAIFSRGAATGASNQWASIAFSRNTATSTGYTMRKVSNTSCIFVSGIAIGGTENIELIGVFVSMDTDGFTINFTTNAVQSEIGYIAYA